MASLDIPGRLQARAVVVNLLQMPDIVITALAVALTAYAAFVATVVPVEPVH